MWSDLLQLNGWSVAVVDSDHVQLRNGPDKTTFRLVRSARRLGPSEIGNPPERDSLLVVPRMSEAAATQALKQRWSVIADEGPAWIILDNRVIELRSGSDDDSDVTSSPRRGRPGFSIYTVLRTLLALPDGATQTEVAKYAAVSQPRVSQALNLLMTKNLVARGDAGWFVPHPTAAVDWWSADYPGPGGIRTHWFGLDPVVKQARRAYDQLADVHAKPVVSGDIAADLVAPWRAPNHALLYAKKGADLSKVGLTPATSDEATLTLVVPADAAVWPIGKLPHHFESEKVGDVARASALHVLWDLHRSDGPDRSEAVAAWRQWMLSGGPIE